MFEYAFAVLEEKYLGAALALTSTGRYTKCGDCVNTLTLT
jgi:hypothetical protein